MYKIVWEPGKTVAQVQCEIIYTALVLAKGDKIKAAKMCGMSIRALRNWVRDNPPLQVFYTPKHGSVKEF